MDLSISRLSLTNQPWLASDVTGANTLYFTDGSNVVSEIGPWPANSARDVFLNGVSETIQSEPWHDRSVSMIPTSSFGKYIGSINPDANGHLNCHVSLGPARRWDVWNAFNKEDIELLVENTSGSNQAFSSGMVNWLPATPTAYGTAFAGLPTSVVCRNRQSIYTLAGASGGSAWGIAAVGWDDAFLSPVPWNWTVPLPSNQPPGTWGQTGEDNYSGGGEGPSTTVEGDFTINGFVGACKAVAVICNNTIAGAGSVVTDMGKNAPVEGALHIRYRG